MQINDEVYYPVKTRKGIKIRVGKIVGIRDNGYLIQSSHTIVGRCKQHIFRTLQDARLKFPRENT